MITQQQQDVLSSLKKTFEQINELELPPSSMMEEIAAEINRATALKLKSEAALKAERSKAREIMGKYVESEWKAILDKFIPLAKVNVRDDGSFSINHSYHSFNIKSVIYEHKHEDKSKYYEHIGFSMEDSRKFLGIHTSLTDFDEAFKEFVISTKKSIDSVYY